MENKGTNELISTWCPPWINFGAIPIHEVHYDHLLGIRTYYKPMLSADDTGAINTANK